MPAHRLTRTRPPVPPPTIAEAVLAVLSGTPTTIAAAAISVTADTLTDAVETYQTAGYRALQTHTPEHGWYNVQARFADWDDAEGVAVTDLGPRLDHLRDLQLIAGWWFIRKYPCWRIRLRTAGGLASEAKTAVNDVLNGLTTSGTLCRWWPTLYEPEEASFGGPTGTEIAHDLFCADSDHVLRYLRQSPQTVGRKEVSMLLCSTLLSAAGLDRFERGDLWNRVAELRPLPAGTSPDRLKGLAERIRPLVASHTRLVVPSGPCASAAPWAAAHRDAGHSLGEAAAAGRLDRGLRHIITHLVIFHWNRLGLSATTQAILSRAAREALLPRN